MRNVKLTLEYDGTDFFGFQKQKKLRTVQLELETALKRLFGKPVQIASASGRTDRGAHAKGQVVNFKTRSIIPIRNIRLALNTYLPPDLSVAAIEEVPLKFHARFDARAEIYHYAVLSSESRSPLSRRQAYHFPYPLDLPLMRKAARLLIGRKDFRSFEAKSKGKNSVRKIKRLDIKQEGEKILFAVEGDGFLYRMVRNLVGALLMVGTRRWSLGQFSEVIKRKNRRHEAPTAPPHGLTLHYVKY